MNKNSFDVWRDYPFHISNVGINSKIMWFYSKFLWRIENHWYFMDICVSMANKVRFFYVRIDSQAHNSDQLFARSHHPIDSRGLV